MSTSLSAVQNQVRKRFGFKADTNELSDDGNRVLDEQEQEEVVNDIRHQIAKSDREHQVGIGTIALLSCVLHVMYLLNPLRTPTAVLFTISDATSPIPLHTAFTCLHLCLQSYLCLTIFHPPTEGKARVFFSSMWPNAQNLSGYVPVANPHLFPLLISSIAPMLCAILHKGWANFTWWCFCGVLFLIHLFVQKGRLRDQTRIEGLERLKYHAKGA